jgi:signal peptidase II
LQKKYIPFVLVSLVLLVDQASKLLVKTQMFLGESIPVFGKYFQLYFIENNGMAFGYEFAGEYGKLFLTLFRLVAVGFISYYIFKLVKKPETTTSAIVALSLILAGALGNIIDSVFYGVVFGYESLFHGRVVDMLYFPLWEGFLPSWIPIWGGDYFIFFRHIFNVADAAITTGVLFILLFQKRIFPPELPKSDTNESETAAA